MKKVNKSEFTIRPYFKRIEKPWGWELILTPPESPVTGKILHLDDGKRFSLQYHDKKIETLTLISGEAYIILENSKGEMEKIEMEVKRGYFIRPSQKHRCQGIKDCLVFEVSTREEGKTVRLEDDYGRGTETEEARKKRPEGKVYMG